MSDVLFHFSHFVGERFMRCSKRSATINIIHPFCIINAVNVYILLLRHLSPQLTLNAIVDAEAKAKPGMQKSSSDTPNRLCLRSELFTDHRPPIHFVWVVVWLTMPHLNSVKSVGPCIVLLVSCARCTLREHRFSLGKHNDLRGHSGIQIASSRLDGGCGFITHTTCVF